MAKRTKKTTEEVKEEMERHPLLELVRKVSLASIGVVALAQEEIEEFVNRLIEQGEIAEKEGRKLIRDLREKRKERAKKAEEELARRVEGILARMNLPTKSDLQALNDKIAELTRKVDELKGA